MRIQEERGSNAGNPRAILLLSLILLVWNLSATLHRFAMDEPNFPVVPSDLPGELSIPSGRQASDRSLASAHDGPLTLNQKYLVGKRIDINKATLAEISELPGISDRVAAAVVERRRKTGPYRTSADLLLIPGIKEKRLQKILPFLEKPMNN